MQLTIEKLIYGGDGLARTAADEHGRGKAVFVPFVLANEKVEATPVEEKPGFIRARTEKVLSASPERIEPACPYYTRCGGCHYQHAAYDHQLEIKTAIVAETLRRVARIELPEAPHVHPSPPWHYRNRTRMKVRGGRRFAIGYYRFGSHELLPVETCPISSPLINQALALLWKVGRGAAVPHEIEEIEFFANHDDSKLLLEMNVDDRSTRGISTQITEFVQTLRRELPAIAGAAIFRREAQSLRHEMVPQNHRDIFGSERMVYRVAERQYQVSVGSFFQTNRHLASTMVDIVTGGREGDYALDLYCGVGLFAVPMSRNFREVSGVEAAPYSYHDLRRNCPANVSAYHTTAEQFLGGAEAIARFDYVVLDPPRGGMGEASTGKLAELSPSRITYVSCDPATLARDLKVLLGAGYRINSTHFVDLFPQTFHIESIVELQRS